MNLLRRRSCIGCLALAALPLLAHAQSLQKPARIAWVASVPIKRWPPYGLFVEAMRELGWVEGTHYVVDEASYDGRADRIAAVVADVVQRKPDLIIAGGSLPMRALINATPTIPIVMHAVGDPVGQNFVASLGRPGGNVTGTSSVDHGILAKQFELLLQAAPHARRIGVVFNPDIAPHVAGRRDVEDAARRLGVQALPVAMRTPGEIDAAVEALLRERADAVHFFIQPFLNTGNHDERLAALALQHRWPTALADRRHALAGILVTYGNRIEDFVRRLPHYVDRILKGTPPGELSVELPTRFYVTVNLKTARTLGLTVPPAVLLRADEVIE